MKVLARIGVLAGSDSQNAENALGSWLRQMKSYDKNFEQIEGVTVRGSEARCAIRGWGNWDNFGDDDYGDLDTKSQKRLSEITKSVEKQYGVKLNVDVGYKQWIDARIDVVGSDDSFGDGITDELLNALKDVVKGKISPSKTRAGAIDVKGDVIFGYGGDSERLKRFDSKFLGTNGKLKIKFGKVSGNFILPPFSKIESLENCPEYVGKSFSCEHCSRLESLVGAPKKVGDFTCYNCDNLINLKGAPKKVVGDFDCSWCKNLRSLEGAPKSVGGYFECSRCDLRSLVGAPQKVGGYFSCCLNQGLESLKGCPKQVGGYFDCGYCKKEFTEQEVRSLCEVDGDVHLRLWL